MNSPPESSIPKPSRRSRRLAILAKQRASDQKPLELRAPRQSLRIALKGSKAPAPKRPDLTAVRKASQQGTVSTKPTRESRRGQQGQKKTPAMRRDFHQALLRQVLPQEDSQVHTSQTKALEAVPPRSWQAIPANEDVALRPALAVFSVPLSHSDGPPESSTRLEPWEVSPRCIRDGSERKWAVAIDLNGALRGDPDKTLTNTDHDRHCFFYSSSHRPARDADRPKLGLPRSCVEARKFPSVARHSQQGAPVLACCRKDLCQDGRAKLRRGTSRPPEDWRRC